MKEFLQAEQQRLVQLLPQTDPTTEQYEMLLSNLRELGWFINEVAGSHDFKFVKTDNVEAAVVKPVEEETVEPTPMAESVQETVVEEVTYTYDQLRAICTDAMSKGVSIKPIIAKYVNGGDAPKLTNVAPEDYAALAEEVKNAQ